MVVSADWWGGLNKADYCGTMPNPLHKIKMLNLKYGYNYVDRQQLPGNRRLPARPDRVGSREGVEVYINR